MRVHRAGGALPWLVPGACLEKDTSVTAWDGPNGFVFQEKGGLGLDAFFPFGTWWLSVISFSWNVGCFNQIR